MRLRAFEATIASPHSKNVKYYVGWPEPSAARQGRVDTAVDSGWSPRAYDVPEVSTLYSDISNEPGSGCAAHREDDDLDSRGRTRLGRTRRGLMSRPGCPALRWAGAGNLQGQGVGGGKMLAVGKAP